MKPRIFTDNDYEMLLWRRVWEKATKKSAENWTKNAIVEQLAADTEIGEATLWRCIDRGKNYGKAKREIVPGSAKRTPDKLSPRNRGRLSDYVGYETFDEFIDEIDAEERKKGGAHLRIVGIIGSDVFLNTLYTSLSMDSFMTNSELFNTEDADLFFRLIKSLKLAYSNESLFTTLSIVADRNSITGKIAMKDYFIQLSYVTKSEIKTRESLVRNETELNVLKIRRSIENNQQLTKDYVINFSLQRIQNLLVLGNPGVGKSTFCHWICHEWSQTPNLDEPEPKRKKPNFMTKSWNCLPNATKIKFPVC